LDTTSIGQLSSEFATQTAFNQLYY